MRPRRAIRSLLVFVLLGAVATVLSAWAIHVVQFKRLQRSQSSTWGWMMVREGQARPVRAMRDADAGAWDAYRRVPPALGPGVLHRLGHDPPSRIRRWGWRMDVQLMLLQRPPPESGVVSRETLAIIAAGWPRLALHHGTYSARFTLPTNPTFETRTMGTALHSGIPLSVWQRGPSHVSGNPPGLYLPFDRFALPLLPLWPGFLINTFLYALLLFIAWRTPGVLRRAVRRGRGRCARCGYDRRGLDGGAACPECGVGVALGTRQGAMGRRRAAIGIRHSAIGKRGRAARRA